MHRRVKLYWLNTDKQAIGEAWKILDSALEQPITLNNEIKPENASGIAVYINNERDEFEHVGSLLLMDWVQDIDITGMGGHELNFWQYGVDKPALGLVQFAHECKFDNGHVMVIDMQNQRDELWHSEQGKNKIKDQQYPAVLFDCSESTQFSQDQITDELGVYSYSNVNDAFYFSNQVYEFFVSELGIIPTNDKLRVRVHYGSQQFAQAFWDGAYINLSDAYPLFYSTVSLDIIAHEAAHAVLDQISELSGFADDFSFDARSVHEAFADITAVMIKHHYDDMEYLWQHGAINLAPIRNLQQIQTESEAVVSFLDRDFQQDNPYLQIGLLSYPFYQLTQSLPMPTVYQWYLSAARDCWHNTMNLQYAANCISSSRAT